MSSTKDESYKERAAEKVFACIDLLARHMQDNEISKSEVARRMGCQTAFVMQIFDPKLGQGQTLATLERVANALGYEVLLTVRKKPS